MFGKSSNDARQLTQEMKKVENEAISSIIDKTMTIIGEINFQGKARIDGIIEGNITGEHLVLSESGQIRGDIRVSSFNCYGEIEGNIQAGILNARKGCSISGTLKAKTLTVEPGACIQGEISAAVSSGNDEKLLPDKAENNPAKNSKDHSRI